MRSPSSKRSDVLLQLDSTLGELTLYQDKLEIQATAQVISWRFETDPVVPGVILVQHGEFVGMISRRRFLERMSRPYALELFLHRPIHTLYRFIAQDLLVLPSTTTIVDAASNALRRSPEYLTEPIVVEMESGEYRLLDFHQLLIAQSRIHELAKQVIQDQTHAQMVQNEKLAGLGRLIANVAHEILNPVNFISGNINYLSSYGDDLLALIAAYDAALSQPSESIQSAKEDIEFEFLKTDFYEILSSMRVGADRLRRVAESLRSFSYKHKDELKETDVHECLDNTLIILGSKLKNNVDVVRQYGELPNLLIYANQLSQVVMNLVSNAADAIAEKKGQLAQISGNDQAEWYPQITIATRQLSLDELTPAMMIKSQQWVVISIMDNGCGIPAEIQQQIFEEFFTTKSVEHGTGLGLAISKQIIDKHGGYLKLTSQVGEGTVFDIVLPVVTA